MTTSYNKSIFESIKNSLSKESEGLWNKVLKFEVGKVYTFRFVPNTKGGPSLFKYQIHGWNDLETGKYTSYLSRKTFNKDEVDPIGALCYKVKKGGKCTPEEQEFASLIKWNEYTLANVYVVDDPSNPENNGTVRIFKFGRKLAKMIESAIKGDDEDEYGSRVFDLTPSGVNFKLKVEKQGNYQAFDGSRFTAPVDLKLSEKEIEEIHNSVYDLTTLNKEYSTEELQEVVRKNTNSKFSSPLLSSHDDDDDDDEALSYKTSQKSRHTDDDDDVEDLLSSESKTVSTSKSLDDTDIESLLAE